MSYKLNPESKEYSSVKSLSFEKNRSMDKAIEIYEQRIEDAQLIYQEYSKCFVERNCPFCSSESKAGQDDFHQTYKVVRCKTCNSLYVSPAPTADALDDYYKNCRCNRILAELVRSRSKKFNVDDRVKTVAKIIAKSEKQELKILEVGCSSGLFLQGLKDFLQTNFPSIKIDVQGIDLDEDAVKNSVDPSLDLLCCSAEDLSKSLSDVGIYDLILNYELIEHLFDPYDFMATVKELLKPGGYVVFTTPNSLGAENLASGYNTRRLIAHAIFPPMHLNAFSTQNIPLFCYRLGFELEEITTPGKLDIDMIGKNREFLTNERFIDVAEIKDEALKSVLQNYTVACMASSHMQCAFRKPGF